MAKLENDCYGCEVCTQCGRKNSYEVLCCDICGDTLERYFMADDEKLCKHCKIKEVIDNLDYYFDEVRIL